jgi:PEP-CTERM motif
MRRALLVLGLMVAGGLWSTPARASAITFDTTFDAAVNEFSVGVSIHGVGDLLGKNDAGADVFGILSFVFDVGFDPAILPPLSADVRVEGGNFLLGTDPDALFVLLGDPSTGFFSVIGALTGLSPAVTEDGLLATLIFTGVSRGDPNLTISNVDVARLVDAEFPIDGVEDIPVLGPTPVPEPSTLGLMGIGLAALARRFRRKPPVAA